MSRHECATQTATCYGIYAHACARHDAYWGHEDRCEAAAAAVTCKHCQREARTTTRRHT